MPYQDPERFLARVLAVLSARIGRDATVATRIKGKDIDDNDLAEVNGQGRWNLMAALEREFQAERLRFSSPLDFLAKVQTAACIVIAVRKALGG